MVGVALGGNLVGVNVDLAVGEETNVLRGRLHNMETVKGVAPAAISLKKLRLFIVFLISMFNNIRTLNIIQPMIIIDY